MKIIVCYKELKIGSLSYNGKIYTYNCLPDFNEFEAKYGYIDYPLAHANGQKSEQMPRYFAEFVERLIHNVGISTKLDINLNKDSYFDILARYSQLPQVKNTFYFKLNN